MKDENNLMHWAFVIMVACLIILAIIFCIGTQKAMADSYANEQHTWVDYCNKDWTFHDILFFKTVVIEHAGSALNSRGGPGTQYKVHHRFDYGKRLGVVEVVDGWYAVVDWSQQQMAYKFRGWVASDYMR